MTKKSATSLCREGDGAPNLSKPFIDADWIIPQNDDGTTDTALCLLAVLMDIRNELRCLNVNVSKLRLEQDGTRKTVQTIGRRLRAYFPTDTSGTKPRSGGALE